MGDSLYFKSYGTVYAILSSNRTGVSIRSIRVSSATNCAPAVLSTSNVNFGLAPASIGSPFTRGTAGSGEASFTIRVTLSNGNTTDVDFTYTFSYSGTTEFTKAVTINEENPSWLTVTVGYSGGTVLFGDSTKMAIAQPAYIDLDIGEAYGLIGETMQSLNNAISLPSDLPKLSSGANTITFDNTITDLKIVPRWWRV